eukprot:CAMPEP_0206381066 /NCGR_PEP_ID=MMETSP0294-20121207/12423_1 /ASSEMBLY_ACC=CAM_ASM_000327 /TAXON_ID=39354 /ORGANISM="Heterosigma akashiwo, Strain CCMP2393" /LENGTH=40 /DNA_ID= /DNA_START= /DNA_END= /DNA_ORIENTATION=
MVFTAAVAATKMIFTSSSGRNKNDIHGGKKGEAGAFVESH